MRARRRRKGKESRHSYEICGIAAAGAGLHWGWSRTVPEHPVSLLAIVCVTLVPESGSKQSVWLQVNLMWSSLF